MFCPKCGTQNPDNGLFCRSCGSDLAAVTQALSGERREIVDKMFADTEHGRRALRRTDPDEAFTAGIRQIVSGLGFFAISMVLFFTNVAGGSAWWWAMLFPAFTFLSTGISYVVRANRLERRRAMGVAGVAGNQIGGAQGGQSLPPVRTDYVAAESSYKTGDLAPPSVVDPTTRHLSMDAEGETMTLPKK